MLLLKKSHSNFNVLLFFAYFSFNSIVNSQEPIIIKSDFRSRPPEIIINNGLPTGPIIKLVEVLFHQQKVDIQWRKAPWARSLKDAEFGKTDLLVRHSMNPQREQYLLPILLGYETRNVHYVILDEHTEKFNLLKEIKGLSIGALRYSFYSESAKEILANNSITLVNELSQLIKMVNKNRIDIILAYDEHWEVISKDYKGKLVELSHFKEEFINGRYLSISKKSFAKQYYTQLNCRIFKMRKNGDLSAIFTQYGVKPYIQLFETEESIEQSASCF